MTPAQLLDTEEQRTWRAFLLATRLLSAQLERELLRDAGMPPGYYELLLVLAEAPRRAVRMSDLAEITQSSPSRISHAVARMEEAGWVLRESCPSDRRGWFAVLTDAGLDALEAASPRHVEGVRDHLLSRLTPTQLRQLREISERLLQHLVEVRGGPALCLEAAPQPIPPTS